MASARLDKVRADGIDFENSGNGYGDRRRDRSEGTIRVCVLPWHCVDGFTCVTTAMPPSVPPLAV